MERRFKRSKPRQTLEKQFPLFKHEDFDFHFSGQWPIALKSTSPAELKRRIGAALISFSLRNRSIDSTYKTYRHALNYGEGDASRLDLRVAAEVTSRMEALSDLIYQVTAGEPKRVGEIMCEWTFLRAPWSIKFLLSSALKGAFFESIAIARMVLEQIAWACQVDAFDDWDAIEKTSAARAIGNLKVLNPSAGRLYGWLSAHAHWNHSIQAKGMTFDEHAGARRLGALFASSELKGKSLAVTLLLTLVAVQAFVSLKRDEVKRVTNSRPGSLVANRDDVSFLGLPEQPNPAKMRKVLKNEPVLKLLKAIVRLTPRDADVSDLLAMAQSFDARSNHPA